MRSTDAVQGPGRWGGSLRGGRLHRSSKCRVRAGARNLRCKSPGGGPSEGRLTRKLLTTSPPRRPSDGPRGDRPGDHEGRRCQPSETSGVEVSGPSSENRNSPRRSSPKMPTAATPAKAETASTKKAEARSSRPMTDPARPTAEQAQKMTPWLTRRLACGARRRTRSMQRTRLRTPPPDSRARRSVPVVSCRIDTRTGRLSAQWHARRAQRSARAFPRGKCTTVDRQVASQDSRGLGFPRMARPGGAPLRP